MPHADILCIQWNSSVDVKVVYELKKIKYTAPDRPITKNGNRMRVLQLKFKSQVLGISDLTTDENGCRNTIPMAYVNKSLGLCIALTANDLIKKF